MEKQILVIIAVIPINKLSKNDSSPVTKLSSPIPKLKHKYIRSVISVYEVVTAGTVVCYEYSPTTCACTQGLGLIPNNLVWSLLFSNSFLYPSTVLSIFCYCPQVCLSVCLSIHIFLYISTIPLQQSNSPQWAEH